MQPRRVRDRRRRQLRRRRLRGTHDHTLRPTSATITLVVFAPSQPGFITQPGPGRSRRTTIAELLEDNNINTFRDRDQDRRRTAPVPRVHLDKTQVSPDDSPRRPTRCRSPPTASWSTTWWSPTPAPTSPSTSTVDDIIPVGLHLPVRQGHLPGHRRLPVCRGRRGDHAAPAAPSTAPSARPPRPATRPGPSTSACSPPVQPGTYTNKALVDPDNTHPEADETNNSDAVRHDGRARRWRHVHRPHRSTARRPRRSTAGNTMDVAPSGTLQYTLDVTNVGTAVAFNVKVQDTLPTGLGVPLARSITAPASAAFDLHRVAAGSSPAPAARSTGRVGRDAAARPPASDRDRGVRADRAGHYLNVANVDPDDAIAENDETNNTDAPSRRTSGSTAAATSVTWSSTTHHDRRHLRPPTTTSPKPEQDYTYDGQGRPTPAPTRRTTWSAQRPRRGRDLRLGRIRRPATSVRHRRQRAHLRRRCARRVGQLRPGRQTTRRSPCRCGRRSPQLRLRAHQSRRPRQHDPRGERGQQLALHQREGGLAGRPHRRPDDQAGTPGQPGHGRRGRRLAGRVERRRRTSTSWSSCPVGTIPQNMSTVPSGWTCQIEENPINKVTCHGDLTKDSAVTFKVDTYVTATAIHGQRVHRSGQHRRRERQRATTPTASADLDVRCAAGLARGGLHHHGGGAPRPSPARLRGGGSAADDLPRAGRPVRPNIVRAPVRRWRRRRPVRRQGPGRRRQVRSPRPTASPRC